MKNSVLITGGTGLIGRRLTEMLLQMGCRVSHLGRSERPGPIPSFRWDPEKRLADGKAFAGVDTVIHLAGAGIAEKRWSRARKKEILDSRVKSTAFLAELVQQHPGIRTVVAGSAIGYYGIGVNGETLTEESPPGTDFLASVVVQWEEEMKKVHSPDRRLVCIRTGIVLSAQGGALEEIARPVRWGVGAPLGNGRQIMSWIHIDDLCRLFSWAIEENLGGTFNGVAPNPVTNRELTMAIGRKLSRPVWLPPIPGFVLRLLLGEMADMVIYGSRISCAKTVDKGFQFQYPELETALEELYPG